MKRALGAKLGRWGLIVYLHPRLLLVFLFGFTSGLPLLLTMSTLTAWLSDEGVSLSQIGLFAAVGLPYSLKPTWSPFLDRVRLPFIGRWMGRRKSWLLLFQAGLIISILGLGASSPGDNILWTAAWAWMVAWFSASQDIVIDAWRIEMLGPREQAAGATMHVIGYRLGMLLNGAGALAMAEAFGWPATFSLMAGTLSVGVAAALLAPRGREPRSENVYGLLDRASGDTLLAQARSLIKRYFEPLLEFKDREHWLLILLFVLFYKLGDSWASYLATPFYLEIGFSKFQVAEVSKVFGFLATVIGGLFGGWMVAAFGMVRTLLVGGILQMLSNLGFALLALAGPDPVGLMLAVAFENISGAIGTAAFMAYLASLCSVAYTATQYALFTSLMAIPRTLLTTVTGFLAETLGWFGFFLLTTVVALPGLVLLMLVIRHLPPPKQRF